MRISEILWEEDNSLHIRRKVSLGVLIYGNRVLIVRRSMDSDKHGGKWGFPGGGIDQGESSLEAIRRECEEEIGVIPIGLRKLAQNERITWFRGMLPCDPEECIRLNWEHDDWILVDEGSMNEYEMVEGMMEIIVKVLSGEEEYEVK